MTRRPAPDPTTRSAVSQASVWLVCLALTGCGIILDSTPTNRCDADGDCTTGRCDDERSMCVSDVRDPIQIGLEFLPTTSLTGVDPVLVSFGPRQLTDDYNEAWVLPSPVRASGVLRDTSTGEAVTADVVFNRASAFPGGQSVRVTAQSRADVSDDGEGRETNFSAQLLPDSTYTVSVFPTGEWTALRPPIRLSNPYQSSAGTSAYLPFLNYPDLCSPSVISAPQPDADCLVRVDGEIVNGAEQPQAGMRIRVADAVTGEILSSTYTTGTDPDTGAGSFVLYLHVQDWLDPTDWVFSVTPDMERRPDSDPLPSFLAAPSALLLNEGRVTILTPDVSRVIEYSGTVESELDMTPVPNATVSVVSYGVSDASTGLVGRFAATALTDENGVFTVSLIPGSGDEAAVYDVVVTPDAVSDLGILRTSVELGASSSSTLRGQTFPVPPRVAYGGLVIASDGVGMNDARVRARARGVDWMESLGPVARLARSNDTLTDLDGRYRLGLDVGVFDITVEPPVGSNYPWMVIPDEPINRSAAAPRRDFALEAPVTVAGTVRFDEGTPMRSGEVRAYAILGDESSGRRAVQIGRTQTDEEGAFILLLPPSL